MRVRSSEEVSGSEGNAEGTKGKVDELQMSRLHMILKPFMLRRIKVRTR